MFWSFWRGVFYPSTPDTKTMRWVQSGTNGDYNAVNAIPYISGTVNSLICDTTPCHRPSACRITGYCVPSSCPAPRSDPELLSRCAIDILDLYWPDVGEDVNTSALLRGAPTLRRQWPT